MILQLSLGFGTIQTAIRAKIFAALGQFGRLFEQFVEHSSQFNLFRMGGGRQVKRHRNLVGGVGNQVQTLAKPVLHFLPGSAGFGIHTDCFVMPPISIRI